MNTKPRILFLVQLPPPVHGASLMNQFLVDSEILDKSFKKQILNLDFATEVSDIGTISFGKIFKMFSFLGLLVKTLFKSKFDLVYFTLSPFGGAFYRDTLFVFVLKLFKSNIVYHLHGKGILEEIKNPIKKILYKFVFKNTSVICLSKLLHFDIEPIFKGPIYYVANGIPYIKCKGLTKNNKELVYLSALKRSKGILDFVEALRILNHQGVEFSAKIIGSSTNDLTIEDLKNIIKANHLDDKVGVLGPIYGENKFNELETSGIFCFPTFYKNECFPLSILEAMMMGVIPVSTNNGAITEIIDHQINGMIVPMQQPQNLATAILELLNKNNKELEILGQMAQKKAKEYYTISVFEKNMMQVFNKILKENG
ncbi:glycosyltransferase family 4 protein [Arenibacter palladensis]|uniref:glycosyltransferase family 4 protein n=1 Tax=Arenibacter palladensis TaxID=237373 RepID=UPI0026E2815D|nr:glycosyltransferase [Arenibacter palladensis]MDO6604345.1 glycosyltransferase [Arenibacter palladensis]